MIILPRLSSLHVPETIHKQTYSFLCFFQPLLSLSIKNLLSLKCQMLAHIFYYISEQYVLKWGKHPVIGTIPAQHLFS